MSVYKVLAAVFMSFLLSFILAACSQEHIQSETSKAKSSSQSNAIKNFAPAKEKQTTPSTQNKKKETTTSIDWNAPSGGKYPTLQPDEKVWIDVSIGKQRVYIKDGTHVLYTMIASSGLDTSADNSTPKGTFYTQAEKGTWFYSQQYEEGAEYWTSWKNHGEFLFHSVPMNDKKQVKVAEAKKLGQKASHGCIRLTISDAKWIYDYIPTGTKVVIHS